ncbi:MAG TPA: 30S ribosomal protein S8 [Candidatus Paceibacterota bacterium]|nr:30S ribosomal protein S8 [Candidatus Paceibacterota bacterium]
MYTDFITRIKNAQDAGKSFLKAPYTKMDRFVAEVLERKGFFKKVEVKGRKPKKVIKIVLNSSHPIRGFKFLSKPSRRIYKGCDELKPVKGGHGLLVVSTSQGIMSGSEARKKKIGGQILFKIW